MLGTRQKCSITDHRKLYLFVVLFFLLVFRPTAQAQSAGDFSVSYGYSYSGQARRPNLVASKQKGPGSLKLWLHPRVFLYVQSDTFKSSKPSSSVRNTGVGDTVTGVDFMLMQENVTKYTPEIDLDYSAKLPTASKGLGSGQVDHQLYLAILKSFDRFSLELDAGDSISGLKHGGPVHSAIFSLVEEAGLGHPNKSGAYKWKWSNEIDTASAAGGDPFEAYDVSSISYKLNQKVRIVSGLRIGITPFTPKFGAFVSLKFSGNLKVGR